MLIDEATIILNGGHGGAGRVSFYPGMKSGPDGGNGGKGGDVYIIGITDLTALKQFSAITNFKAENGQPGDKNRKFGKDGSDLIIKLPVGSSVKNLETEEEFEVVEPNKKILICKGGLGGRGNFEFKSPRNTTPEYAQPGLPGEQKRFFVNLKFIADFGLIGLPNAGKSSLLNELTNANAKVANYSFTTLEPNLGVFNGKVFADLPGLIEGASSGKGLGIKFLKHIEKTRILVHCISTESEDLLKDYKVIKEELESFNPELASKQEIILLTKSDLVNKAELTKMIKKLQKKSNVVLPVSVYDFDSVEVIKQTLQKLVI